MYWKYLKYLLKHKWYVLVECFNTGLFWRGLCHDISKFRLSEFVPYTKYFYGNHGINFIVGEHNMRDDLNIHNKTIKQFNVAWLLHQKRNKHHWQWWILREDSGAEMLMEMHYNYALEMVCDWRGAGMAINGKDDTVAWYEKNKDKMQLHKDTRNGVEAELKHDAFPVGAGT